MNKTVSILISSVALTLAQYAGAQGTAFTYQGKLTDGANPASGLYDITFTLFDAATAGNQVGSTLVGSAMPVTNGLFTTSLDFGSGPFTGAARWLQVDVKTNGSSSYTALSPRTALSPTPYAIYAENAGSVAAGVIGSSQLAANAVAAGNLQANSVTAAKIASGQVVKTFNGLTDAVSLVGDSTISVTPSGNTLQLSVTGGELTLPYSATAAGSTLFGIVNSGSGTAIFGQANNSGGWGGIFRYGYTGANAVYLGGSGNAADFEGPVIVDGALSVNGSLSASSTSGNGVSGSTGTGTAVFGQANSSGGWGGIFRYGYTGANAVYLGGSSGAAEFDGGVVVNGDTSVRVLTITGGSDVAEPFKMPEGTEKGAVVVIDEVNPGQLKVSEHAYDTHVAGIVSGADGINPGLSLHQDGVLEGGKNVALSGRVKVMADASNGAIRPGDLLTTSDNPGHCMKVTDHAKAQGAIIGKAMSSLERGNGYVLVLVSLQ